MRRPILRRHARLWRFPRVLATQRPWTTRPVRVNVKGRSDRDTTCAAPAWPLPPPPPEPGPPLPAPEPPEPQLPLELPIVGLMPCPQVPPDSATTRPSGSLWPAAANAPAAVHSPAAGHEIAKIAG